MTFSRRRMNWQQTSSSTSILLSEGIAVKTKVFVVPLAGPAEPVAEQIVAHQFGERPRPLTLAIAADLRHRNFGVVV